MIITKYFRKESLKQCLSGEEVLVLPQATVLLNDGWTEVPNLDPTPEEILAQQQAEAAQQAAAAALAEAVDKRHDEAHNHDTVYEAKNTNIQGHISSTSNPHSVTKSQVGLENVDNTTDTNKPVSSATQTALDGKASSSHSHSPSDVTGTAVVTNDSRLSDARTPLAHSNHAISDVVNLQTSLDSKEPSNANIQAHVTSAHAPSNAQKNSDITKAEIEAKLTGEITSHTHAGSGGGVIVFLGDI